MRLPSLPHAHSATCNASTPHETATSQPQVFFSFRGGRITEIMCLHYQTTTDKIHIRHTIMFEVECVASSLYGNCHILGECPRWASFEKGWNSLD